MWTLAFWRATLERAIKTFAQGAAAILAANAVGIMDADWGQAASVAAMGAVLSVLTSIGTAATTDGGPSVGNFEKLAKK